MHTRDKILATALCLFNTQGTSDTTVRHIAKELGISHGNLCYHFPRTDDIIQQLYFKLVAEIDTGFPPPPPQGFTVLTLVETFHYTFARLYAYRFLLLDFVRIMRTIPTINQHYKDLYQRRRQQVNLVIAQLLVSGDFQSEQYAGQHEQFVAQLFLLGDSWVAEAEILLEGPPEAKLAHYTRLACGVFFQYLTPQGQATLLPLLQHEGVETATKGL